MTILKAILDAIIAVLRFIVEAILAILRAILWLLKKFSSTFSVKASSLPSLCWFQRDVRIFSLSTAKKNSAEILEEAESRWRASQVVSRYSNPPKTSSCVSLLGL